MTSVATGAYGLRYQGLPGAHRLLVPPDPDWPVVTVTAEVGPSEHHGDRLDDDSATLGLQGGGIACVDRATSSIALTVPRAFSDEELLHPFLSTASAVINRWLGRQTFHAGAFAGRDGAWAVAGAKGAGKSSTLGWLALQGVPLITDDLLVIDGGDAFAGPASVDLRPEAAAQLGAGDDLGVVGVRERWRLRVAAAPARSTLAGWIIPEWGDTVAVEEVRPGDRLPFLFENLALRVPPRHPEAFLSLATTPCFRLRRPQTWDSIDDVGRALADLTGAGGD